MRLLVSLSAINIGDRVSVQLDDNRAYFGTVQSIKNGRYVVKLNIGVTKIVSPDKLSLLGNPKVVKEPATKVVKEPATKVVKEPTVNLQHKVWAISDVHGCYKQFKQLLSKLDLEPNDRLYVLGDYIDRGPDSKKLLDYIIGHKNIIGLIGNHEKMLLEVLEKPKLLSWWLENGGYQTLLSFGVDSPEEIPKKYITWIKKLKYWVREGNTLLSHAGMNLHHEDPFRSTDSNKQGIIWNRNVKNNTKERIVYGHTPQALGAIKKQANSNQVCIDGGCAYGGVLVAFCLTDNAVLSVQGTTT